MGYPGGSYAAGVQTELEGENGRMGNPSPTGLARATARPGYFDDNGAAAAANALPTARVAANTNVEALPDPKRDEGDELTGRRPAADADTVSRRRQQLAATMGYQPPPGMGG